MVDSETTFEIECHGASELSEAARDVQQLAEEFADAVERFESKTVTIELDNETVAEFGFDADLDVSGSIELERLE